MKARKAYKFPIYPTRTQTAKFEQTLDLCRELYNAAVQERRDAYRAWERANKGFSFSYLESGVAVLEQATSCPTAPKPPTISFNDQCAQLPVIKEFRPEFNQAYSQVLQDVLHRVDKTFKAFFARCKRGNTPSFPRFVGKNRYHSFTYPQLGWSLQNDRLTLFKIGTIRVKLHREVIGKVKTCTIIREGERWFVCFSVETEFEAPVHSGEVVGIDLGLENVRRVTHFLYPLLKRVELKGAF